MAHYALRVWIRYLQYLQTSGYISRRMSALADISYYQLLGAGCNIQALILTAPFPCVSKAEAPLISRPAWRLRLVTKLMLLAHE